MAAGTSLTDDGDLFSQPQLYRTLIGSLQYLTYTTRLDIAFTVNKLSQFMAAPKMQHWLACKRLLRYIKGTAGLSLIFSSSTEDLSLMVYTDADHAGCKVTHQSTTGFCVYLDKNLIVWGSKKQPVVARSMGEAKYRAVALGVTELVWLKHLLLELGYSYEATPIVWCDNLAAKSMAENPVYHSRTKHIGVDVHFVREKVENGEVEIRYVPTAEQVADVFTKGLPRDRFNFLCTKLGLTEIPTSIYQQLESKLKGSVEELNS